MSAVMAAEIVSPEARAKEVFEHLGLIAEGLIEEFRVFNGRAYSPAPINPGTAQRLRDLPLLYQQALNSVEPSGAWASTVAGAGREIRERLRPELSSLPGRVGTSPMDATLRALKGLVSKEKGRAHAIAEAEKSEVDARTAELQRQITHSSPNLLRRFVSAADIVATWTRREEHAFRRDRALAAKRVLGEVEARVEQIIKNLSDRAAHYEAAATTLEAERHALAAKLEGYLAMVLVDEPFNLEEIAARLAERAQPAIVDPRASTAEAIADGERERARNEADRILNSVSFADLLTLQAEIEDLSLDQARALLVAATLESGANAHAFVPAETHHGAGDRLLITATPGGQLVFGAPPSVRMAVRAAAPEVDLHDRLTALELVANVDLERDALAIRDAFAALERAAAAGRPRALLPELLPRATEEAPGDAPDRVVRETAGKLGGDARAIGVTEGDAATVDRSLTGSADGVSPLPVTTTS